MNQMKGLLVLLVALFAISHSAETPKFSWYQDNDSLFLSITTKGCDPPGNLDVRDRALKWSCGEKMSLDIALREDVLPEGSSCKTQTGSKGSSALCKLQKKHPHHFDRLTFAKSPASLKRYMTTDWSRSKTTPPESLHNEEYEEDEDLVPTVTAQELQELQAEHTLVVADVMFPWCQQHTTLPKIVIEAARKLRKSKKIKFAFVNALEERGLARTLNVTCDQKPKLHLWRQTEPHSTLESPASDTLVDTLKGFLSPATKQIKTNVELMALMPAGAEITSKSALSTTVVAFVAGDEASEEASVFRAMARTLKRNDNVDSHIVYGSDLQSGTPWEHKRPFLVAFRNGAEAVVRADGEWSLEDLALWSKIHTAPAVHQYKYDINDKIKDFGLPIVQVWASTDGKQDSKLTELSDKYRGKFVFVKSGTDDKYMMDDYGFGDKDISSASAFGIAKSFEWNEKFKYGCPGDDLADASACLEDFLAGKLTPSLKSKVPPSTPAAAGQLNVAVATTVKQLAQEHQLVVALYKSYISGWSEVEKALESTASLLKDLPGLLFAKLDTAGNGIDPELFKGVDTYHEKNLVYLVSKGPGEAYRVSQMVLPESTDMLTVRQALLNDVKQKIPELTEHWGAIDSAIAKEEEEAKVAEEARKAAEAQKYENAEKVEIEDGVTKFVFTKGQGETPNAGDEVTAHYTGTLENGEKFDSSVDRGDPFKFTLGQGQVIKCWDKGFATMKVGEKAELKCNSDNAYGDRGSPPKIPGGATLLFSVELISFKPKAGDAPKSDL